MYARTLTVQSLVHEKLAQAALEFEARPICNTCRIFHLLFDESTVATISAGHMQVNYASVMHSTAE